MTERWPKVLSIMLGLLLILAVVSYIYQGIEIDTLRSSQELTLQTLHNQTQLIAELRMELAGERYQNFESAEALEQWASHWTLFKMPIVVEFLNTDAVIRGQTYSAYYDCDDLAEAMQRDALRDGYLMSEALVDESGMIYGVKVTNLVSHAGNMAIADNAYWYVEPTTGKVVHIIGRD